MYPIASLAKENGLLDEEIIPMGRNVAKVDGKKILSRLEREPLGKYIVVTAMTPTPFGEGKTTTTIGLVQGLGKLNKKVTGAIRQPSSGPTFNIKGSAAGGGMSRCIPLDVFSLGLTGDIDAITNAHNLCMVALTSRLQHENNYSDEKLSSLQLTRLDIDPKNVLWKWAIDFCAQALRHITIGQGGKMDGFEMESSFQISVSSELMAILAISKDLKDLRERISKIVVAYDRKGAEITTKDLKVDGAMTALMVNTIHPTILQTLEKQLMFVHAGPFANIAVGQSSILADEIGLKLSDYHVTECGFGADIGFEKFWDIKCRLSKRAPDAAIIVATIRSLKMHGGGPSVKPGEALPNEYTSLHLSWVEKGIENLLSHIAIVKSSGISPIVCLNHFPTDTNEEISFVKKAVEKTGARFVVSKHFDEGGHGALELAKAVVEVCEENKNSFHFLYEENALLRDKIFTIATKIYGAKDVYYEEAVLQKILKMETDPAFFSYQVCMVKTHLSLSHDPLLKGAPIDWVLPVRDLLIYRGARLIVPVTGAIQLMPGTCSHPAYMSIDVDTDTGEVKGLF